MAAPPEPPAIPKVRFSLRLKLALGLILILGLFFAGLNTYNILEHRAARRAQAESGGETVARMLAGALVAQLGSTSLESETNKNFLRNALTATIHGNKKNRELAVALVSNAKGEVVVGRARPDLVVFPGRVTYADEARVIEEVAKLDGKLGGFMRVKRFPLKMGDALVGKLIVGTSLAAVEREAQRDLILNIGVLIAALVLLSVYAGFALGAMVVRPLNKVVDAMRSVQEGHLDVDVPVDRKDELGVLAGTYNFMVRGLREREHLKDAFSRFVDEKVYEKFRSGSITLTGETRQATVLFSDIRSFTNLSEALTPGEVVALLNEYFTEMVEIVFKYDGFLNKFIGDAIMAIYNVPIDQNEPELRAVRTAVEMVHSLNRLNERRKLRGKFPIRIGIGINTGPVIAGNIGHEKRLEYTVIGDTVNLAQRIESQTKVAGTAILISESTYKVVAEHVVAQELAPVKVKGKAEAVLLYAVQGLKSEIEGAPHSSLPIATLPPPQTHAPAYEPSQPAPPPRPGPPPAAAPSAEDDDVIPDLPPPLE